MLQIQGISKVYKTGGLVQQALDGVSLNLRDSEFVAILGQSGSGKTTLLNIIGGLDRYDEGDLIINGISTKQYSDRDWDSYRNHTVGFVFQSYNLIPHQTILANVELALTIGGISRRERTRRAREALEKVGLAEHVHKRPSQLSGGQMQRVAIARALVNDPDILLADEPTGALDSDTSIQVMDLLKEVASDRLVVMVTHNPELAEQYATRVVNLRDGHILSDSDPFVPDTALAAPAVHKNMGKASMSLLTGLLLSFNNLRTKKARTILVAVAGSIGIIGIAMILSMSNGVDRYIQSVEEDTLQGYPLQITDTSFDFTSFYAQAGLTADNADGDAGDEPEQAEKDVKELRTVTNMLSRVNTNDLKSLKAYLDSDQSDIARYTRSIAYTYNISPQIYAIRGDTVRQVNPDKSFAALGFSATDNMSGMLSSFSSTDTFHAMPADESLYKTQYDVKAGHWPEAYNECVLVLTSGGRVTDLTLYTLGLKDPMKLDEMVRAFAEGGSPQADEDNGDHNYEDFLGIQFRLVPAVDYYVYDAQYKIWTDKTDDPAYMRTLVDNAEPLTIVGVVQPKEDASATVLSMGIGYPDALIGHLMDLAADSRIVQSQLADPQTDVFTARSFGDEADGDQIDMNALFSVDEEAIENAFTMDENALDFSGMDFSGMDLSSLDLTDLADPGSLAGAMPTLSQQDVADLLGSLKIQVSSESMQALFTDLLQSYLAYAQTDPATDYAKLGQAVGNYLNSDSARQIILDDLQAILAENSADLVSTEDLMAMVQDILAGYPAYLDANGITEETVPYEHAEAYLQSPEVQAKIGAYTAAIGEQAASVVISQEQLSTMTAHLYAGYETYAVENALPDPGKLSDSFSAFMQTEQAQSIITSGVAQAVDTTDLEARAASMFSSYSAAIGEQIASMLQQVTASLSAAVAANMSTMMETVASNIFTAISVDGDALAKAFSMSFTPEELRDLMTSLLSAEQSSSDSNLRKLGYADPARPTMITIYPIDFESKTQVKRILDTYNDLQRQAGDDDKVIAYTDMVDTLMSSVTDIINAISYVLIAFVAISLVVSSIMIGVITYISVLERNKEIGILRAIGASKRNISQVFNAETFIIGALAGVFGIVFTWLLLIPANQLIHRLTGQTGINAVLPPSAAGILILLSIVLTLIGGIIPSRKAARSDPVTALRSE